VLRHDLRLTEFLVERIAEPSSSLAIRGTGQ
jgi:hypothetical protein